MTNHKGYTLDSEDRLVEFWGDWGDFSWQAYLGKTLWSLLSSDELADYLRAFFAAARKGKSIIRTRFVCTLPEERIEWELEVEGQADNAVRCRLRAVERVSRPPVPDPPQSSEDMVVLCSWCGRIKKGETWVELEAVEPQLVDERSAGRVTHGLCGVCSDRLLSQLHS